MMTMRTTFLLVRNLDALVKNRRGMLRSSSCHNLAAPGLEQREFVSHQIEPLSSEVNMSTLCFQEDPFFTFDPRAMKSPGKAWPGLAFPRPLIFFDQTSRV